MFEGVKDYKVIDSVELNRYVEKKYGKVYSCSNGLASIYDNVHQEMYKKIEVGPLEQWEDGEWWFPSETHLEAHNEALENWEGWGTSPEPSIILNELHAQGELPAGKYVLLVWW